jgi:hypothetical protein
MKIKNKSSSLFHLWVTILLHGMLFFLVSSIRIINESNAGLNGYVGIFFHPVWVKWLGFLLVIIGFFIIWLYWKNRVSSAVIYLYLGVLFVVYIFLLT